ncbi:MAG: type II toxin-antitoxin system HipA family toxin [Chloroflexota bacterium]
MSARLDVFLGVHRVGAITLLQSDLALFVFDDTYVADPARPVLSQSYITASGALRQETRPTRTKLPPWFSNLLPEGRLREYLARRGGVNPTREFQLLRLLGEDLPGAVRIATDAEERRESAEPSSQTQPAADAPLRFSLAGVQLKFSALLNRHGGLTIPASGLGGDWIIKLPSPTYPAVPENECTMLTLAGAVGIEVPEHRLVPLDTIEGLPELGPFAGKKALAVRRFDRGEAGRVHMEDLAQVFGVFPDDKYQKVGLARIATTIGMVIGQQAAQDFVARLAFIVLTGNGDMHLKNWSLLYPDTRTARLAPAYDLVSTVPYMLGDSMALNFLGERSFAAITHDRFRRFALKAALSEHETLVTVARIADAVRAAWPEHRGGSELPSEIADRIERHMRAMPLGKVG